MSQRKKRRKSRAAVRTPATNNRLPWLLIGFALLVIGGAFLLLRASQNSSTQSSSTNGGGSSSSVPQVAGAPRVYVSQDRIDHGDMKLNVPVNSVFTVRNVGDQDLVFLGEPQVELVEGC